MKAKKPMPTILFLGIILAFIAVPLMTMVWVENRSNDWDMFSKVAANFVAIMLGAIPGQLTANKVMHRYYNGMTTGVTRRLQRIRARDRQRRGEA
ncbi:MAG: hypothetical protein WA057_03165 [Candidatus Magasanikiibacteriota bacterium]